MQRNVAQCCEMSSRSAQTHNVSQRHASRPSAAQCCIVLRSDIQYRIGQGCVAQIYIVLFIVAPSSVMLRGATQLTIVL